MVTTYGIYQHKSHENQSTDFTDYKDRTNSLNITQILALSYCSTKNVAKCE